MTVQLGAAHVDRVEEQQFPVPFALLADDFGAVSRWIEPLPGGFLDSSAMTFQFVNQSWLIRADGLTVLVDPCNGNWRRRRVPYFNHRDLPWLEHLHAAGAAPEDIDVVFSTHLHNDHCGWNTNWAGDRWVPTFSSARYLFVEAEYQPSWPRGAAVPRRRVPVPRALPRAALRAGEPGRRRVRLRPGERPLTRRCSHQMTLRVDPPGPWSDRLRGGACWAAVPVVSDGRRRS